MNILEQNKIDLTNYLPEELREEFKTNAFLAGGAVYCYINGEDVQDYDFFLKDELFAKKIHNYFKHKAPLKFGESGNFIYESMNYNNRKVIITPNAITFKGKYGQPDWQIITKFVGQPMDVISEFDFKHNMLFWDDNHKAEFPRTNVVINGFYYKDTNIYFFYNEERDLYYGHRLYFNEDRARDISGVLLRLPKFLRREFTISKKEHSKIIKKLLEVMGTKFKKYEFEHKEGYLSTCTNFFDEDEEEHGLIKCDITDDYVDLLVGRNRELEILDSYLEY